MMATTFWSPDGKPISAAQFIEQLYGDLPDLFKNEDELIALWSKPDTRKKLLAGLTEKGYGEEQLAEVRQLINAEKSDLFDVLAYIAFASAPITRAERVNSHKDRIFENYADKQQQFLSFVLDHYITQGVGELDQEKLPVLLELKYNSIGDAVAELGNVTEIRDVFIGFQEHLYVPLSAA
jgi:type I restriction enzyme R subunit